MVSLWNRGHTYPGLGSTLRWLACPIILMATLSSAAATRQGGQIFRHMRRLIRGLLGPTSRLAVQLSGGDVLAEHVIPLQALLGLRRELTPGDSARALLCLQCAPGGDGSFVRACTQKAEEFLRQGGGSCAT